MNMTYDEALKNLTMALMYLTRWSDTDYAGAMRPGDDFPDAFSYEDVVSNHAWKGYDYDVLNALTDEDLIRGSKKSKSVWMTPDGVEYAKTAVKKLGIELVLMEEHAGNVASFSAMADFFLNPEKLKGVSDLGLEAFVRTAQARNKRDWYMIENAKAELSRRKRES